MSADRREPDHSKPKPSTPERPSTPEDWRELLKAQYDYPEDLVEADSGRKARKAARKGWRAADREARRQYVRELREREPATPGGIIVIVVALLVVGGLASQVFPGVGSDDRTTVSTGSGPAPSVTEDSGPGDPSNAPSPSASDSPAGEVDRQDPDLVAEAYIKAFLTRDPVEDQGHEASVRRAAPWMTTALKDNLIEHPDPDYTKLVILGGVATVKHVTVEKAGTDLPGDIPKARVYRAATSRIAVKAEKTTIQTRELHLEMLYRDHGWVVSRILDLVRPGEGT
ncbi:hypothetical protein ACFYYR_11225 [Streptomyces sp. NPDC001922]|uniref:hypothetical protein n=1 Tax=Streptomyces sp. NPDC001922 TaxID=3364624 RepID=UPI0036AAD49F